jgi:polyhydroxyalkanoate synthase
METGQWMKMTDPSAFQVGKTLATTKGEVVYRNHLFELIHYAPLTNQQYSVPLLVIPPWINKYYIFDLSSSNSFVKWMVEQGHNVFMISWINPGSELASMTFEDYLIDGAYRACEVISSLTKSPSLHTMGYCVGGNLLTALNAYLAKAPASFSIQTMTLLATVVDFEKMGDLRVFIDEEHLQQVEKAMAQDGFLNGEILKSLFSLLRPNDLVWSFFIKNYFLGQIPPAFDFLYWNSDSTRLPEGLHGFILRKFFQENLFMKPAGITIKGIPLDLKEIRTPAFLLSTTEDHISPWQSTYPAVHLFKGPVEFVLAGSGHVAGVINHPSKSKYGFFTNASFPENAHEWLESSIKKEGSWWTAWQTWVSSFGGEKISPLTTYPFLESAPGSYVMAK